jgi:hypothetical protein
MSRILKLITINLISFAILLALLNWGCGVYLKRKETTNRFELPNYAGDRSYAKKVFHDYNSVQHLYEPFTEWKMKPYAGTTLHVSHEGLRQHTAPSYQQTRKKSVHFFGGSTMWGEGSDDDHTIPAIFNQRNPEYAVVNHGQLAYNSRQELDALISLYATGARPDVVVFYDGVNDAAFLCPKDITQLPAHRLVPMYREKLYVGRTALAKDVVAKVFYENILKVIHKFTYKPDADHSPYDCISNPEKAEQIAEMMMVNWEMAHEIVTARNGQFKAFLQPAAFIGKPRTDHLKLDDELGKNFQAIYTHLRQKIRERNHPWIVDLTEKFDGDQYIYIDFCHVSPNGNEIIANEISGALNNKTSDVSLLAIHP